MLKNDREMWLFYNFIRFLESYAVFLQIVSALKCADESDLSGGGGYISNVCEHYIYQLLIINKNERDLWKKD